MHATKTLHHPVDPDAHEAAARALRGPGSWIVTLAMAGCIDGRVLMADDGAGTSDSGASASSVSASESTTGPSSTTTTPTSSTTASADDASTSAGFLPPPADAGGEIFDCDFFSQDCPAGHKCMPWANDGGGAWNAFRCSPVADDPIPVDGTCHVEGSATSGLDDCEFGALCYGVDPETLEGTCAPMCIGSVEEPFCADPGRYCYISGAGTILPCIAYCRPIEQDCPTGEACYPIASHWTCAPDASGDFGAYGDPCELINVCDPGLVCLDASVVPPGLPCEGRVGCCTEICDVSDPAGDAQCSGAAGGQQCLPWYTDAAAPVVVGDVGVCAMRL